MTSPPTHAPSVSIAQIFLGRSHTIARPQAGAQKIRAVGLHPQAAPTSAPTTRPRLIGLSSPDIAATSAVAKSAKTAISLYAIEPVTTDQGVAITSPPAIGARI